MNNISFFKTLNDDMLADTGYQETPAKMYFFKEGREIVFTPEILTEGATKEVLLKEETYSFDFSQDDLHYSKRITFQNHQYLFGKEGLVSEEGEIGLGVKYFSKESQQQYTKVLASFKKDTPPLTDRLIDFVIPSGYFRGNVVIEIILFAVTPIAEHFPLTKGTVLGKLESTKFLLEGEGGSFPILHHADPNEPLWWVDCNWEDAAIDTFHEDYVSLNINRQHPDAKDLKLDAMPQVSPMLKNVITSALYIIAQKVIQEEYNLTSKDDTSDFEEGSIASAISYFLKDIEEDKSSPEILAKEIQKSVHERFEGM
ncbi:hypothetical protein [Salimicrobium salexigens]|uniref:Uncharacterized protein n=1 Tax=Salimicrobium salexigens TaxID=908941 RepID=A0ABY1KXQ4_9BACI|nr:hypothetical protein [Salimicrobium salexigens]SIS90186.1 hypothetical protein SAMN05421758_10924 [Salimicrobium salexigens]